MEQYARVKRDHPDAFLFFRLGDFYEMFFEDAVQGAALLGLTLTSRNRQDPDPIPMCGIPWHQRDAYVARLLRLGHKVAICDQLEDAAQAKGLVQRGVTEVLTPGSVTGDAFLDPAANNFLAALWPAAGGVGVCLADASTGEVKLAQPPWEDAAALLSRLRVAEWVLPLPEEIPDGAAAPLEAALRGLPGARSPLPAARFDNPGLPLARFGEDARPLLEALPLAAAAAAAALDYLDRVQGGAALQLTRLERWDEDDTLRYDAATARHLELFQPQPGGEPRHTLWHQVNLTVLALGGRRLRGWLERPLAEPEAIARRLDTVASWAANAVARGLLRDALRGLPDLERLAARVACAKATPRDLGGLRDALARLPAVAETLEGLDESAIGGARAALAGSPALEALLRRALTDDPPPVSHEGGIIRPGYDARRDRLDDLAHSGKRWIAELESTERARTGIPSLKVGYNRVFGYYLEVTRPHLDKVPEDYERRQTLTTAERFVTPGLKAKESEVLSAEEKLRACEHELFVALREQAAGHVAAIQRAADALGTLDAHGALAEAAARFGWVRPEVDGSDRLEIEAGRHPVVERLLPRGEFVPNGVDLDGGRRQILLVTGPNMGGKSTYLRQVALIVLLAQAGSFVPAERARIGRVDRLFTRVGAADRLGAGHSTFMVEMRETADILRSATPRSLVLLDEVGRGTSTYDGLALAWAVTEHLHESGGPRPRTIFATHYHELTQLAERLPRLANVHVTVKEWGEQVVFLHRIAEGAADRSYGIHVAQLAGLPARLIARAREVLAELESERTAEHLAAGGAAAVPAAAPELPLFAGPHPLETELRGLDPERLTPLEALQRLAEWKRRWGGG
ncbi:MAG: DNA mismatch repair protein MutS [Candidatus Eisenbacteria bacterium RBG_16_71_46]|nr:MAG: DNA mismatch repair protein MutS [Candidatus Eisenbacteria bacterium RBG_16_71_46]